jgi:hypothetical protein
VDVEAEIDIAGKMAQFGRGLMEDVSRQLFRQFAANMQEHFARPVDEVVAPPVAEAPAAAEQVQGTSPQDAPTTAAAGASAERAPRKAEGRGQAARSASPPGRSGPPQARPVGIISLVFRALWSRVKRLVGS